MYRFLLGFLFIITSCISPVEKGEVKVSIFGDVKSKKAPLVDNITLENDELTVTGSNFADFVSASLDGNTLSVLSNNGSTIVFSAPTSMTLAIATALNFTINTAHGAAAVSVTFNLLDDSVTASAIADEQIKPEHFSTSLGNNVVPLWNGTNWVGTSLSGLSYEGSWNANTGVGVGPDAGGGTVAGEYYIIDTAGTIDLGGGPGTNSWAVGDWAIWNNTLARWEKVDNSTGVKTFNGRSGTVTATANDYTWAQIDKTVSSINDITDVDTTTASAGLVLKYDGSKWVAAIDETTSAGSVTTTSIADGTIQAVDLDSGLSTTLGQISTNTATITSNISNISTNTSNITTNTASITSLSSTVSGLILDSTAGSETDKAASVNSMKNYVEASINTATSSISAGVWNKNGNEIYYDADFVGIGVSGDPRARFHVGMGPVFFGAAPSSTSGEGVVVNTTSARSDITFLHSTTGNSQPNDGLNIAQVFERAEFNLRENGDMIFKTNNTEALRISNVGDVGIGTATPQGKFSIYEDHDPVAGTNVQGTYKKTVISPTSAITPTDTYYYGEVKEIEVPEAIGGIDISDLSIVGEKLLLEQKGDVNVESLIGHQVQVRTLETASHFGAGDVDAVDNLYGGNFIAQHRGEDSVATLIGLSGVGLSRSKDNTNSITDQRGGNFVSASRAVDSGTTTLTTITDSAGVRTKASSLAMGANSTLNITNLYGVKSELEVSTQSGGSSNVVNAYGMAISNDLTSGYTQGNISNLYGLHIGDMSTGTLSNYAIYSAGGDSYFAGSITASAFVGDGSNLTGVAANSATNTGTTTVSADSDNNTTGGIEFEIGGTTQAVLDNGGNFGLGTTSPGRNFHVHDSSGPASMMLTNNNSGTGLTDGVLFGLNGAGTQLDITNYETGDIVFNTTNGSTAPRMTIKADGKIGIGTTTPAYSLDVVATDAMRIPAGTIAEGPQVTKVPFVTIRILIILKFIMAAIGNLQVNSHRLSQVIV